jgi:PAS domain S-box-containing protein
VSSGITRLLSWDPLDVIGRSLYALVHPEDRIRLFDAIPAFAESDVLPVRLRMLGKDGSTRWVDVTTRPVVRRGQLAGFAGGWRDAESEQQAQEALERRETQYRLLAANASDIVLSVNGAGDVMWAAPTITATLGWFPESMVGRRAATFVHVDDRSRVEDVIELATQGHEVRQAGGDLVVRMRTAEATFKHVSMRIGALRSSTGEVEGLVVSGSVVDDLVVARREAEAKSELLQATADAALESTAILRADRDEAGVIEDFVYEDANHAMLDSLRVRREDVVGMSLQAFVPAARESGIFERYAATLDSGGRLVLNDFPYESVSRDGTAYVDIRARSLTGDRLAISWRDVTDRHEAAARIAESEQRYRLLVENLTEPAAHVRGGVIEWISPAIIRDFGYLPQEVIGHRFDEFVHPDDVQTLTEDDGMSESEDQAGMRVRVRLKDGNYRWVSERRHAFIGADGLPDGRMITLRIAEDAEA